MKYFLTSLLMVISGICLAGPRDSLKSVARSGAPADEPLYNFGTLMMDFVKTRAYDIAMKHLPESYAGKSINGYQVLLDRGRAASNLAINVLKESDALLAAQVDAMAKIRRLDSIPGNSLSARDGAAIAAAAELARNYCLKLGAQREQTIGFRSQMENLGKPFTLQEFKLLGMHRVPANFIMTTIGGSQPGFDMTISVTYSMNEDGGSADNSQNIFTSFYELFSAANESWQYRQEVKIFQKAIRLLPKLMPADTTCYRIYRENDSLVMLLYGEEPRLMKGHLDSLTAGLENRFKVMMKLVAGIEDGLLYDRIRSGFAHIGLSSFSQNDLLLVRKRANEIAEAREMVEGFREVILTDTSRAQVIRAKEDMLETTHALADLIRLTDSIPIYAPLKPFLLQNLDWFQRAELWVRALQTGPQMKMVIKSYLFPAVDSKILADINGLIAARSVGVDALVVGEVNALVRHMDQDGLSISAHWPLIPQGSGVSELYGEQGTGIWAKGSDGSYIRDRRKTWEGVMRQIYDNLDLRTSDLQLQYAEASGEVRSNAVNRSREVTVQSGILQILSQNTQASRSSIPNQSISNVPTSTPEENRNWELDPRYYKPQTVAGLIDHEREKLERFISGLPEDVRNSSGIAALKQKHEQFLQYAAALREAGYIIMANNMVNGATSVRAAAGGQVIDGRQIPSFSIPDIPFGPFTTADKNLILERNRAYNFVNGQLGGKSLWFQAAGIVTDLSALHLLDVPGLSFIPAADFLRSTNESLFAGNIQNANAILEDGLKGSFTTPNNEVVVFDGLKGKALDYALVEYEQSRVQEQILKYQQANPSVSMPLITAKINFFMNNLMIAPVGTSELRQAMFPGFNFADYNDRVRLGKRLIDILYARRATEQQLK